MSDLGTARFVIDRLFHTELVETDRLPAVLVGRLTHGHYTSVIPHGVEAPYISYAFNTPVPSRRVRDIEELCHLIDTWCVPVTAPGSEGTTFAFPTQTLLGLRMAAYDYVCEERRILRCGGHLDRFGCYRNTPSPGGLNQRF